MDKSRKILAITGIRSDYDIMSEVFKQIRTRKNLELHVVATGAHLSPTFGYTVDEIVRDGNNVVEKIESLISGDKEESRLKSLSIQLVGLIQTVIREKPDILLVLGDREESINTAICGAYLNIPVAHIGGGDRVVGNVDDQIRHAVTKLSHIHFVTNEESEKRVLKLGEQSFRIFNVGNPGLDRFVNVPSMPLEEISQIVNLQLSQGEFVVCIQHVISTEVEQAAFQMKTTLEALAELRVPVLISYPNSDAGGYELIREIEKYKQNSLFRTFKNIPREIFVNLLRNAGALIGNSSCGIMEAPLIKLPVINVGNRQSGRLHANNVQFVAHDPEQISFALNKALFDQDYKKFLEASCTNPYGEGNSSKKIADILGMVELNDQLIVKDITF